VHELHHHVPQHCGPTILQAVRKAIHRPQGEAMNEPKLYKVRFGALVEDWRFIHRLVSWCNSYSRFRLDTFDIVSRDAGTYRVILVRDAEMPQYVREVKVIARGNEEPMKSFLLGMKRSAPKLQEWTPATP
jgi:hypothetical protein